VSVNRLLSCLILLLCASLNVRADNPVYESSKREGVHVVILALSTSTHQTFAGNQDTYLAVMSSNRDSVHLVKLIDVYRATGTPIRRDLLAGQSRFRMKVTRYPGCDVVGGLFFLGRQSTVFDPQVELLLRDRAADSIPCYKVDHEATRLDKHVP